MLKCVHVCIHGTSTICVYSLYSCLHKVCRYRMLDNGNRSFMWKNSIRPNDLMDIEGMR